MLALLVGFVSVARHLGLADRASLGYGVPRRLFIRELCVGFALGVVLMLLVVALMVGLGLRVWQPACWRGPRERYPAGVGQRARGGLH